jgi:Methyl-accepting chemotaxis protein
MLQMSENETIDAFIKILPYLPELFDSDTSFAITNREVFLVNQNCKNLQIKSEYGDPIQKNGAAAEAIKTGKMVVKEVSKVVYGVPFKSYAVPIKDKDGCVVGTVLEARSLERSKAVLDVSLNLSEALKNISTEINALSVDVQGLAKMNSNIALIVEETNERAKGINGVLKLIKNVSSQTNLLGLNAAIEAAKAGESGRGFTVVAKEIRKLSSSTSDSINEINIVLKSIEDSIELISRKILESNSIFTKQATSIEEIASSLEDLRSTAQKLNLLSEKL